MVEVKLGSATAEVDFSMSSESGTGFQICKEPIVRIYTHAAESSIYSRPLNCSPLQLIQTAISRGDPSTKDHRSRNINSSIPNIMQPIRTRISSTEGAKLYRGRQAVTRGPSRAEPQIGHFVDKIQFL